MHAPVPGVPTWQTPHTALVQKKPDCPWEQMPETHESFVEQLAPLAPRGEQKPVELQKLLVPHCTSDAQVVLHPRPLHEKNPHEACIGPALQAPLPSHMESVVTTPLKQPTT